METLVGRITGNLLKMERLRKMFDLRLTIPSSFVVPASKPGLYKLWVEIPMDGENQLTLPVVAQEGIDINNAASFVIQRNGDEFFLYMVN